MPMIVGPPTNSGIQPLNHHLSFVTPIFHDYVLDLLFEALNFILSWNGDQFPTILPEVLSEKIKAFVNMDDPCFLLREYKPSRRKKLLYDGKYDIFKMFFGC